MTYILPFVSKDLSLRIDEEYSQDMISDRKQANELYNYYLKQNPILFFPISGFLTQLKMLLEMWL
jgi:hypothetical protein